MIEYVCNENQKDGAHLVGKASDAKAHAVTIAPQVLATYVGTYTFRNSTDLNDAIKINVTLDGDTLFMDTSGKDKQAMIPLSASTFSVMGVRIEFTTDDLIFHLLERDTKATKDR